MIGIYYNIVRTSDYRAPAANLNIFIINNNIHVSYNIISSLQCV